MFINFFFFLGKQKPWAIRQNFHVKRLSWQKSTRVLIFQFNYQLLRSLRTNFAKTQCPYLAFYSFPPSTASDSRSILFEGQSLKPLKPHFFYFHCLIFHYNSVSFSLLLRLLVMHSCSCKQPPKRQKTNFLNLIVNVQKVCISVQKLNFVRNFLRDGVFWFRVYGWYRSLMLES